MFSFIIVGVLPDDQKRAHLYRHCFANLRQRAAIKVFAKMTVGCANAVMVLGLKTPRTAG